MTTTREQVGGKFLHQLDQDALVLLYHESDYPDWSERYVLCEVGQRLVWRDSTDRYCPTPSVLTVRQARWIMSDEGINPETCHVVAVEED
jgi:hypothetical protein